MGLVRQLLKTFIIWLFILVILIAIILFPRTINYHYDGVGYKPHYEFSFSEYKDNVVGLVQNVWTHKSLGETRFSYPVEFELKIYMSRSLWIILSAFIISMSIGVLKGIYDYRNVNHRRNIFGNGTTWFLQSMPDFFIVIALQIFIIYLWKLGVPKFPFMGNQHWSSFIIPALLTSIYPSMYLARITSTMLASQDREQYIQTAKAKGLTEKAVVYKHALGNCWGVIFTHMSSIILYILSNLLVVEYLMFYRGVAYRFYEALGFNDGTALSGAARRAATYFEAELIIGFTISFMLIVLAAQFVSQIAKYILDPRWREQS